MSPAAHDDIELIDEDTLFSILEDEEERVNEKRNSSSEEDEESDELNDEETFWSILEDEKEKFNKKRNSSSEEDEESDKLDDEEDNVTSDTKFPCRLCSQEFDTKEQRKKHERKDHETQGLFSCDLCSYTSTQKYYLVKHKSRHIKDYNVFCKICQLGFLSKNELDVHNIKQHDAQPHTCPVCKKIFVNKVTLAAHKKIHLPIDKNCQCDVCGKSFARTFHLKSHISSVHLKRGAQCKICLKVLNCKEALTAHSRIHNDENSLYL
ncbi:zinc finger and BTB domain-containing protein 49 [Diaphorina citri]|uniref:Zinc finger and BTB domain-containing protein 49 n=1 Tax=Diaphorina citri TaxID=121845 RepID=A0A3Q0INF5_DIACI|nr:zinc finger and BTB domain-containing protein 49 [Diaphorina citri]